jgi:hypothetical protein
MKNLKKQIEALRGQANEIERLHENALGVLDEIMKETKYSLEVARDNIKTTHAAIGEVAQINSKANKVSEKIIKELGNE